MEVISSDQAEQHNQLEITIRDFSDDTMPQTGLTNNTIDVKQLIHTIRGEQVIFDFDLARLYQVDTGRLNQAVKRNARRFPPQFCFQLDKDEVVLLKSQNVISKEPGRGGRRSLPKAFTEQGVAMLSAILHSDTAIEVSIQVMEAFVQMRRFIANNAQMYERMGALELRQLEFQKTTNERFDQVFNLLETKEEPTHRIYFQGQVWDALSLLEDLIHAAEHEIILIDGYIDKLALDILSHKREGVTVHAYTLPSAQLTKHEVATFNAQHPELQVHQTTAFHDRYLVLDGTTCYHIGASLKDAGKKGFSINLIQDQAVINALLAELDRLVTC